MKKVVIEFGNEAAAENFLSWLCGSGEQAYWDWMEGAESEEEGDITALTFIYDWKKLSVKTKTGRLDRE